MSSGESILFAFLHDYDDDDVNVDEEEGAEEGSEERKRKILATIAHIKFIESC